MNKQEVWKLRFGIRLLERLLAVPKGKLITCILENRVSIQQVFFDNSNKINVPFEMILSTKIDNFETALNVMRLIAFEHGFEYREEDGLRTWLTYILEELKNDLSEREYNIFYSWQSDLSNSTNRNFIENALKKAIDDSVEELNLPISFDKDTQERSGSPEIARVIFEKIDRSLIFVADVSFINTEGAKKLPNPNVLVETGYALSSLGDEHVILIFNDVTGQKEDLPFDLKSKRITTYSCSNDCPAKSKQEEKKKLVTAIKESIRIICDHRF
ncbi:hypothetical protein HMPREF9081_0459 [Centipeda periodontii DSM 2778]|uniref:Uncharacterized protein n=1 Tax=Centipeda periodontii DSM 2778 TaxID=888060 RepID=F5RJM4_9FIRM|nr:hypothetical protein [Centipeda periodontii]EGK61675.1 hypothetical protein HMPREF9081_0459 [Centipeda periodontii DSM 2778]